MSHAWIPGRTRDNKCDASGLPEGPRASLFPCDSSKFATSSAECGADAVLRHAGPRADFLVAPAFEVLHADDVGFESLEVVQELLDLILIADALLSGEGGIDGCFLSNFAQRC